MAEDETPGQSLECALVWKLARVHGWSATVTITELAREANIEDDRATREVARNQVASRQWVGYHNGRDAIWLRGPPSEDVLYFLRDECGYTELQIEATFDSYFDGF